MSAGYAARLSEYPNKGVVGLPESFDSVRQLKVKLQKLQKLVQESRNIVVLTGAGISTSAGIPDFRGPKGIWTAEKSLQQKKKRKRKECESIKDEKFVSKTSEVVTMNFSSAQPTLTHRAITRLAESGKLKYCVTQNVDGLHRRSGLKRNIHCALHGCAFTEKCSTCFAEFFRDTDIGGMSFQPTGNNCTVCGGELHDTLLDWEDPLPEDDFERALEEFKKADLAICLGTSLRIEPAGSLPLNAKKFAIVNLQVTPYDGDAEIIIRAPVDEVMDSLLQAIYGPRWQSAEDSEIERIWIPQGKNTKIAMSSAIQN